MSEVNQVNPKEIKIVQPLNCLNSTSGNPRKFLIFYNAQGVILDVEEYNYMGIEQATRHFYPTADPVILRELITPYKEGQQLYKWHNQKPSSIAAREKAWQATLKRVDALQASIRK